MKTNWHGDRFISLIFGGLILFGIPLNLSQNRFYDNSWTIGEWLINYAGGYVRRGLPGHIIHIISSSFFLNPVYIVWATCILAYIFLAYFLWIFCKNKFRLSLLLSPVFLLAPITGDFFVRKDVFILFCYGLSLYALKKYRASSSISCLFCFLVVNIISIIAICSHESYGFFALPSLVVIVYLLVFYSTRFSWKLFARSALFLFPSIVAFFASLTFKGSGDTSMIIHASWQYLSSLLPSQGALSANLPTGAIDAIGWSTNRALSLPIATLDDFSSGIWIPAVWVCTIYACASLIIGTGLPEGGDPALMRTIIIFQLLMFSPLFILGWDYGRWIFMWTTSSALLYGFADSCIEEAKLSVLYRLGSHTRLIVPGIRLSNRGSWALLFAGIPGCCWSIVGFIWSTPIFYAFNIVKTAIKMAD